MGRFHSGNTFVTDVFNVVVLIAGGLFLYNGQIQFGDYSAFIVSINMFIGPVMTLINFMEQFEMKFGTPTPIPFREYDKRLSNIDID